MAKTTSTKLEVASREPQGSRDARRRRRAGLVLGVVYGAGGDPQPIEVGTRQLRHALASQGAVLELSIDGAKSVPVVLKDRQRDVVRGDTVHVDFVRVNLDQAIQAVVTLELVGGDDAPGVREGGVLEGLLRELNIEALPADIPESIELDVSALKIGDTLTVSDLIAPSGVTLLDDADQAIATISAGRLSTGKSDEIAEETERVGDTPASSDSAS